MIIMSLNVYLTNGVCQYCGHSGDRYDLNITHNLNKMAAAAGIYRIVWRPEENGIKFAKQLIKPLRIAILKMKKNPEKFKKFDAINGWGRYEDFVPWLEEYLKTCEKMPFARVSVSR